MRRYILIAVYGLGAFLLGILYFLIIWPRQKLDYMRGEQKGAKVIKVQEGIFSDKVWFDPNQKPIDESMSISQFWNGFKAFLFEKGLIG